MERLKVEGKWKRKRLELIAWAGVGESCFSCGVENVKLNVHHRYYEAGKAKWDYPVETLDLLCNRCHGKADELRRKLARATGPLGMGESMRALGYMEALNLEAQYPNRAARMEIRSVEHAIGIGDLFELTEEDIWMASDPDATVSLGALADASPAFRYAKQRELREQQTQ